MSAAASELVVPAFRRPDGWPDVPVVDADVQLVPPSLPSLFPFLDDRWVDYVTESGVRGLDSDLYPPGSPLTARPGSRPASGGPAGSDPSLLRDQLLDPWRLSYAIGHVAYGIDGLHNPDWATAMAAAANDWQRAVWLADEPRLRGSVVVADQDPHRAADEVDRCADDPAFAAVQLPVRSRLPLGNRYYWPIYAAAERHRLPVVVHAGGSGGHPLTPVGPPSYYLEEYVALATTFQAQLVSLVSEGVFARFGGLMIVFAESGYGWLPPLLWRFDKNWKGLRREVPWVDRPPSTIITDRLRITGQPSDAPAEPHRLARVVDQLGTDELLIFATDYPHHQFDDPAATVPPGVTGPALERFLGGNALDTFRLPEVTDAPR